MQLIQHADAYGFDQRVRDFLRHNEALHHDMLSKCYALTRPLEQFKQCPDLLTLESNREIVAVAIALSGNSVFISAMANLDGVDLLAQHLKQHHDPLTRVNAPTDVAQRFALTWSKLTGQHHRLEMTLCAYRLEKLRLFNWTAGQLRQATEADLSLVSQWYAAFSADALNKPSPASQDWATRQIHRGHAFLWEDGDPVSMGCKVGRTANGFRVSIIYTPPEHRRKGYGKTCTALLTQRLLDDGQRHCFLYADKENAVTNRMYEAIGYELMGETQNYRFNASES